MQVSDVTADRIRRLAGTRAQQGRVISFYLNLDPSEFATPAARSAEIQSLLDEAERRVRKFEDLPRDERLALREDVARARNYFDSDFSAEGAHGLALFASTPANLFEALRLARPVETTVVIDEAPFIEPLAETGVSARWCVALVNRSHARILRGTSEHLREVERLTDDFRSEYEESGGSRDKAQDNYEGAREHELELHLERVAEALFGHFKAASFDRLVIGAPQELCSRIEAKLHSYLRQRIAGCIHVDVENSTPDEVLVAVTPAVEADEQRSEREALDRLAQGIGAGERSAAGLEPVLFALTERRVETLLVAEGFSAPGTSCPTDGWLGPDDRARCPVDDTPLRHHDNIVAVAVEAAIAQSAEPIFVRHYPDLGPLGQIGAVLRF
jgi:hypothetical protein